MPVEQPQGDLARCITHEPKRDWPDTIEIVAYWKPNGNGRGKKLSAKISGDEFFGLNTGAPMSGDQLIGIIERLRKTANGKRS